MSYQKAIAAKVPFTLQDTTGAFQAGKVVTAQVWKDAGAFGAAAGAVTEIANGAYYLSATIVDMTADYLLFRFSAAGCRDEFVPIDTEAAYTATRAALLDNADAAISSRSTYAGADTAGTTTLLARLTANRATLLDNLANLLKLAITGTVNDNAATVNSFISDLTLADTDAPAKMALVFATGLNAGIPYEVLSYNAITKAITPKVAFLHAPANGDAFALIGKLSQ